MRFEAEEQTFRRILMRFSSALVVALLLSTAPILAAQTHRAQSSTKRQIGPAARIAEAIHLNNLGAAYMNEQQFARALNLFNRAAALNPKLEIAKINAGIALANLQRYGQAVTILNALATKDHGNAHVSYTLGLVYKNEAKPEKSLEAFENAARLVPNDPDVFYFIGVAQSELDQNEKAVASS